MHMVYFINLDSIYEHLNRKYVTHNLKIYDNYGFYFSYLSTMLHLEKPRKSCMHLERSRAKGQINLGFIALVSHYKLIKL